MESVVGATGMKARKAINVSKLKNGEGVVNEHEVLEVCFCPITIFLLNIGQGRELDAVRGLHRD